MDNKRDDGRIPFMIAEYEQMQERKLFHQQKSLQYISQALIICGVTYYFGINNFHNLDPFMFAFVNIVFMVITPIILFGLIPFAIGADIKCLILTKYITIIDDRVNKYFDVADKNDDLQRIVGYDAWWHKNGWLKMEYNKRKKRIRIVVFELVPFIMLAIIGGLIGPVLRYIKIIILLTSESVTPIWLLNYLWLLVYIIILLLFILNIHRFRKIHSKTEEELKTMALGEENVQPQDTIPPQIAQNNNVLLKRSLHLFDVLSKIISTLSGIAVCIFVILTFLGKSTVGNISINNLLTICSFTLVGGLISIGGIKIFSISASLRKNKEIIDCKAKECPFVLLANDAAIEEFGIINTEKIMHKSDWCGRCPLVDRFGKSYCVLYNKQQEE